MARTKRKRNPVLPVSVQETPKQHIYYTGGYVRLSVEDSGKSGTDTIKNQKELVKDYIESQPDMEFCGLYCDNGQTGTNFYRPEWERLLQDIKSGKINCIVVKDLSRFGRNYLETGNYLERMFPFLGVRFVAIEDNFDSATVRDINEELIPLKNIFNEIYSRDISKKVGSALAIKQQKGEFIGAWAAYGYQKCADHPHKLEPDKKTAFVVKEIFQWRLSGMSYKQIAQKLNELEIPSPSQSHDQKRELRSECCKNVKWGYQAVKRILSNRVYLGHTIQRCKRQSLYEGKKQQMLPESEWMIVYHTHEAILDEKTFQAVQEMAQKQRKRLNLKSEQRKEPL